MKRKIFKVKESCEPLFRKGDLFVIIKKNKDPGLMPIEARHLKSGEVYGLEINELEKVKDGKSITT